jgi:hypothetical protein
MRQTCCVLSQNPLLNTKCLSSASLSSPVFQRLEQHIHSRPKIHPSNSHAVARTLRYLKPNGLVAMDVFRCNEARLQTAGIKSLPLNSLLLFLYTDSAVDFQNTPPLVRCPRSGREGATSRLEMVHVRPVWKKRISVTEMSAYASLPKPQHICCIENGECSAYVQR